MIPPTSHSRAVLTLAAGPVVYWNMAINLARSIRLWHSPEDLPITIATDHDGPLPPDLADVSILKLKPGELGKGFETKLHLDRLAPAPRTLFIDADCLIYARLDDVFARFAGQPVAVVQERIASEGERFGDIASYCRILGVKAVPVFTGGLYYIERATAGPIYDDARRLLDHYDEYALVRLRGLPNEEVLMAGAMARENLWGIPDDGTIMGDFQRSPGEATLKVLSGHRTMSNPPDTDKRHHCCFAPVGASSPTVVHFLAYHTKLPPYRADTVALALSAKGMPNWLANLISRICILWPGSAANRIKDTLRPVYHRAFGTRVVGPTDRTCA